MIRTKERIRNRKKGIQRHFHNLTPEDATGYGCISDLFFLRFCQTIFLEAQL